MSIATAEKLLSLALKNPQVAEPLIKSALEELREGSLDNSAGDSPTVSETSGLGLTFPIGIRGKVNHRQILGRLLTGGRIQIGDASNSETPSGSASRLLGYSEDGWRFWRYQDTGSGEWWPIDHLRKLGYFDPPTRRRRRATSN